MAFGFLLVHSKGAFHKENYIKYVALAGVKVKVELALTPEAQTKGLSGRDSLAPNTGMLFVFAQPGKYYFWMKGMNFPIDMIWLAPSMGGDGGDAYVVYIKKDAKPELYLETYGPEEDAKYVLEVPAGFSDKNNLELGDSVSFSY